MALIVEIVCSDLHRWSSNNDRLPKVLFFFKETKQEFYHNSLLSLYKGLNFKDIRRAFKRGLRSSCLNNELVNHTCLNRLAPIWGLNTDDYFYTPM